MRVDIPKYFNRSHLRVSGIYFLIRRNKVVYIGKSVDVFTRIFSGDVYRFEHIDSVRVIQCDPSKLYHYEKRWIIKFRPKHNRANLYIWRGSLTRGVSKRERIPINLKASGYKEVA